MEEYMKKMLKRYTPEFLVGFIRKILSGNYFYFLWLFPIKSNKIVVCNYYGKGYGDNGKYIVEKLIEDKVNCEIVWLLKNDLEGKVKFPDMVRTVKYGSFKAIFEMATAKIWIDNCRKLYSPPKRKSQYYIQTWHGGIALKRIEKDVQNKLSSFYVQDAKYDSRIANLFLSNSTFCTNLYNSTFWYEGEILECGSPRCDILVNENSIWNNKIRDFYNIDRNKSILIYAPTFRADLNTKIYNIDFERLIKTLEKKFSGDWVVLVRLHPNVSTKDNFMTFSSKIINATNYDDMYELMAGSDILITDYSSSMFEFSFMRKPVFLYAPDIIEYTEDRDFYFDIFSLPYSVAEGNEQLVNIIEQFNYNSYIEELDDLLSKIDIKESGKASAEVAKKVKHIIS
jgi:CDP-glycerol glycerophosphotransferase